LNEFDQYTCSYMNNGR